jgi:Tol biopolymer transport system component
VANANGSGARRILRQSGMMISDLNWSPDGRQIYFAFTPKFFSGPLQVVSSDGGSAETVLPLSEGVSCPRISPDGKHIAYYRGVDTTASQQSPYGIKLLDLATRQTRSVVSVPGLDFNIAGLGWTRDGQALLFSSRKRDQCQLARVDLANPQIRPLGPWIDYWLSDFSTQMNDDAIALLATRYSTGPRRTEVWLVDPATGSHKVLPIGISGSFNSLRASPLSQNH